MIKFFVKLCVVTFLVTVVESYLVVKPPFSPKISSTRTTASLSSRRYSSTRQHTPTNILFSFASDNSDNDSIGIQDKARHVGILDKSLKDLTGRGVYDRMSLKEGCLNELLNNERFVLISHDTQADPIYNFGNQACLNVFARTWQELCTLPSAKSVVTRSEDEALRKELMQKVTNNGYVEGATGIRVTGDGRLIRLVDAVVSNTLLEGYSS